MCICCCALLNIDLPSLSPSHERAAVAHLGYKSVLARGLKKEKQQQQGQQQQK
jgi:hypothetical protein